VRHARAEAGQSATPSAVTITFSEFPVGTAITTQYSADDGIVFQGDSPGDTQFISSDADNPDSPELSGTPQFVGDVGARFVVPGTNEPATVDSVSMDVGYIDNPGSTQVNAYDSNGALLGSVVANQTGWNHLTLAFNGIASFIVTSTSDEAAGFGVDNVTFVPPRQIAVSSVTVSVAMNRGINGAALPADVIDDRVGVAPLTINQFQACGNGGDAQWVDCSPAFPDGTPEKSWPVVFERSTKVTLSEVRLKIKDPTIDLGDSTVTGTTTVGGATLTFSSGPVSPQGGDFVITNLTSDNVLPDAVNSFPMTIQWTVQHGTTVFNAGSSTIPIYLTLADPSFAPYLSLEALTSAAAANQTTESGVFNSIWTGLFSAQGPSALHIHPQHLDPASGTVTADSQTLQYWTPWTLASDYLALDSQQTCSHLTTPGLLEYLVSRCGDWANFLANIMAVQGITTVHPDSVLSPEVPGTFPKFPNASPPRGTTFGDEFMLIKNWIWPGAATGGDRNFPYLTTDTVRLSALGQPIPDTGILGSNPEFNDAPGVPGQNDPNPPGWFTYGDHAIDVYNNMVYDPSYGLGPFPSIGAWATSALAGFAYDTYTESRDAAGNLIRTYTLYGHMGLP
jgi:hypothetical protein